MSSKIGYESCVNLRPKNNFIQQHIKLIRYQFNKLGTRSPLRVIIEAEARKYELHSLI